MKNPHDVLISPVYTEKSLRLGSQGAYTFVVDPSSSKIEIRAAIEEAFDVKVVKVNTLNRKGKRKRNPRMRTFGKRADTKRAIVILKPGDKIDLFES